MKKVMIFSALLIMVSASAYAASTVTMDLSTKSATGLTLYGADTADAAGTDTPLIGKTSTGVGLSMATGTVGYALATQHMNGSKAFASSYDSTSIFSTDVTNVGDVMLDITASDTSEFSDWKPL